MIYNRDSLLRKRCTVSLLRAAYFALVALVLLTATPALAQQSRESAEIALSRAILLYDDKKYDDATRELMRANQLDPRNTNVIYYLALSLSAQGRYAEAEAYVRKGLEIQPNNANLRLMLASTLRAQGKIDESRQIAESLQLEPASPLVGPSRDLLTALRTPRRGDTPFWFEASVRSQYDTNVTLEANKSGRTPDDGPKNSPGNLLTLSTEYAFWRTPNWQAAGRYDLLQTINYHNHKFDYNEHTVGGRLTYNDLLPSGQRYFVTFRPFYDITLQQGRLFLQRPTGVIDSFLFWDRVGANRTQLFYQLQGELYNEHPPRPPNGEGDDNRDALNHRVGLVHYIFFDGQRYGLNFGYHYDFNDAVGQNWAYSGHRAVAGVLVTLPWEIRATANFEFHARHYNGLNSAFFRPRFPGHMHRSEHEYLALFNLAKDITPNLTVSFEHLWNSNESSIAVYDYKRQVYSVGLTWRYY